MIFRNLAVLACIVPAVLVAACEDDAGAGPSAEIRQFCASLFSSSAFACCSAADRAERQFAFRAGYANADDCASRLAVQLSQSEGRQAFSGEAASSCLAHLGSRGCGVAPSVTVRAAEEAAGCGRVMAGLQWECGVCTTHEDCKPGLVCPPVKETGLSYCSTPAGTNQNCIGSLPVLGTDHPACIPNHICTFVSETASGCVSPPCAIHQCVPFAREGEECTGYDCPSGTRCLDGPSGATCTAAGPSGVDGPCRVFENCQDGLYCVSGLCKPRKNAGEPCESTTNLLLECKGFCKGDGASAGVCASFCASE